MRVCDVIRLKNAHTMAGRRSNAADRGGRVIAQPRSKDEAFDNAKSLANNVCSVCVYIYTQFV